METVVAHLDFNFNLYDGCYDGEDGGVCLVWPQLPRLERHVDVGILQQRHCPKMRRLEPERPRLYTTQQHAMVTQSQPQHYHTNGIIITRHSMAKILSFQTIKCHHFSPVFKLF